jgi:hypothetical protein
METLTFTPSRLGHFFNFFPSRTLPRKISGFQRSYRLRRAVAYPGLAWSTTSSSFITGIRCRKELGKRTGESKIFQRMGNNINPLLIFRKRHTGVLNLGSTIFTELESSYSAWMKTFRSSLHHSSCPNCRANGYYRLVSRWSNMVLPYVFAMLTLSSSISEPRFTARVLHAPRT